MIKIYIAAVQIDSKCAFRQALARLTPQESYDRGYRLKRASQASILHKPLEKDQWTPATEVCRKIQKILSLG